MDIELLVSNQKGITHKLDADSLSWKTTRKGRASVLDFSFPTGDPFSSRDFEINNGDIVRLQVDSDTIFYGNVVSIKDENGEAYSITAQDQLRILMYSDTYIRTNMRADEFLQLLADNFQLNLGNVANTGYVIPKIAREKEKLIDMMDWALSQTLLSTGNIYILYDNAGKLELKDINEMKLDIVIGDRSFLNKYSYAESIESDVYNQFKLVRINKEQQKKELYIVKDSEKISRWGLLQYYEEVDSGMNPAQIQQKLDCLSKLKGKEKRTFDIDALGDPRVRAGTSVFIHIPKLGMQQYCLVEEASHKIQNEDYTMKLTIRMV